MTAPIEPSLLTDAPVAPRQRRRSDAPGELERAAALAFEQAGRRLGLDPVRLARHMANGEIADILIELQIAAQLGPEYIDANNARSLVRQVRTGVRAARER